MHSIDKAHGSNLAAGRAHVGDLALKENSILGSGYSGEVKEVEDDKGHSYALKVSNDRAIKFILSEMPSSNGRTSFILPEASEFERLRRLYMAGVPVPKPHGFQLFANAEGTGTTALLMDLIDGATLRDWLSAQHGGVSDKMSGRSMHPALTISDAIARVDVAVAVLSSLIKLRPHGLFADFKPRNVMIREQRIDKARWFSASLVDIGGVVMYQDVSTSANYVRPDSKMEDQSTIFFHPIKDRYLIETTCSYLSPEMAVLISEYDYWRGRLHNHFFPTKCEAFVTDQEQVEAERVYVESQRRCSRNNRIDQIDVRVVHNYLQVRKRFRNLNVLSRYYAVPQLNTAGGTPAPPLGSDHHSFIPYHSDIVIISEKSTVYTMGLVLAELFGGKRTGLTSLTRLRAVNDIFSSEHHNAEFRIAMEWEARNPLLRSYAHNSPFGARTEKQRVGSKPGSNECGTEAIAADSYFDLYRRYAYPSEGLLRVATDAMSNTTTKNELETGEKVRNILDSCLRFDPKLRPTLAELVGELTDLKRHLCAKNAGPAAPNKTATANSNSIRAISTSAGSSGSRLGAR